MNFLKRELEHFRALPQKARDLLLSYFYFSASYPLITIFINAFIWKKEGSITSLALYNIGNTIMLPIIFYANGLLLKKFKSNFLYFFGAVMTAVIPAIVILLPQMNSFSYFVFGFLFGAGYGMYWANRNYFTYQETASHNRNYFLGINFSANTITGILVPITLGWFIYLVPQGYQISIVFAFILLFLSGLKVVRDRYQSPTISHIAITKTTPRWWASRFLVVSIGAVEGISLFLPTLLILTKLGAENILGSFNSLFHLLAAVLIYSYGRRAQVHHRKSILLFMIVLGLVAAVIFGATFNPLTIVFYLAVNYLTIEFMWLTSGPIMMDIMDEEKIIKGHNTYALIFDQELFLDLGRIVSFMILFLIIYAFGQEIAIRFTPITVYLFQLGLVVLIKNRL